MKIILVSVINAPIKTCFDLSRSIDLHTKSMHNFNEEVISGKTSGLININESVTWRAKHFGINFVMTNEITEMVKPDYFVDGITKGPFALLKHEHVFKVLTAATEMTDIFEFKAPFGIFGRLIEKFYLSTYMKKLLLERNILIKKEAEN